MPHRELRAESPAAASWDAPVRRRVCVGGTWFDNVTIAEAIEHIDTFGTGHSEAIVTEDLEAARAFTRRVDAAAVYVNASTRFTDGGQFGLGAELGISTQKLHARGPIGLEELTTLKYVVWGDGQVRT